MARHRKKNAVINKIACRFIQIMIKKEKLRSNKPCKAEALRMFKEMMQPVVRLKKLRQDTIDLWTSRKDRVEDDSAVQRGIKRKTVPRKRLLMPVINPRSKRKDATLKKAKQIANSHLFLSPTNSSANLLSPLDDEQSFSLSDGAYTFCNRAGDLQKGKSTSTTGGKSQPNCSARLCRTKRDEKRSSGKSQTFSKIYKFLRNYRHLQAQLNVKFLAQHEPIHIQSRRGKRRPWNSSVSATKCESLLNAAASSRTSRNNSMPFATDGIDHDDIVVASDFAKTRLGNDTTDELETENDSRVSCFVKSEDCLGPSPTPSSSSNSNADDKGQFSRRLSEECSPEPSNKETCCISEGTVGKGLAPPAVDVQQSDISGITRGALRKESSESRLSAVVRSSPGRKSSSLAVSRIPKKRLCRVASLEPKHPTSGGSTSGSKQLKTAAFQSCSESVLQRAVVSPSKTKETGNQIAAMEHVNSLSPNVTEKYSIKKETIDASLMCDMEKDSEDRSHVMFNQVIDKLCQDAYHLSDDVKTTDPSISKNKQLGSVEIAPGESKTSGQNSDFDDDFSDDGRLQIDLDYDTDTGTTNKVQPIQMSVTSSEGNCSNGNNTASSMLTWVHIHIRT